MIFLGKPVSTFPDHALGGDRARIVRAAPAIVGRRHVLLRSVVQLRERPVDLLEAGGLLAVGDGDAGDDAATFLIEFDDFAERCCRRS